MATPINKILSNQTQAFSQEELANISASLQEILGQGGGGTQSDYVFIPVFNEQTGDITFMLSTTGASGRGPWHISGAQGPAGADGANGTDGKDGKDGKDGYSVTLQSVTDEDGGKKVTLAWGETPETSSFVIPSGAKGADGQNGQNGKDGTNGTNGADGADACPISAKSTTTGKTHNVKIFYTSAANPDTNPLADFNVLDGQDGQGSSYVFDNTTISGNGSQETPYGVNTDILATQTWVEDQHYIANVYDIVGNNGISAEKDTANNQYIVGLSGHYVNVSGDTMTGPLVVNSTTNHPIVGISQRGDSDDFAVFGATRKKSNNNFGTTWLGVGQDGQGVLKNIPNTTTSAATEPASNGAYTQITFSQDNNAVPSVDINAKLNGDNHNYKSVVVPQQSYNSMSSFDATNGPNYMLRKLNNGSFDIGACVINVTEVPTATEANTYYFVYDLV